MYHATFIVIISTIKELIRTLNTHNETNNG